MEAKKSSLVDSKVQRTYKEDHLTLPTWSLVGVLLVCLFVLKTFIYIKDKKRHGK